MEDSFSVTESTNSQGEITQVQVPFRVALARLCLNYVINNGKCDIEDCTYLHVCKDYITDSCRRGEKCAMNHQLHNQRDKALLSRIGLDQLAEPQLQSRGVSILDDKLSVSGQDDTKCELRDIFCAYYEEMNFLLAALTLKIEIKLYIHSLLP